MTIIKNFKLVVGFSLLLFGFPISGAVTESVGNVITIESIRSMLSSSIKQAEQSGDYLVWRAGIEAQMILDSTEATIGRITGDLDRKLTSQQMTFFRGLNSIANSPEIDNKFEALKRQNEEYRQLIEDVKFWNNQTAIFRHYPSVITPKNKDVLITLRGTNLDINNPIIRFEDGAEIPAKINVTKNTILFELPSSVRVHKINESTMVTGILEYESAKSLFNFSGKKELVKLPISFLFLPQVIATVELEVLKTVNVREDVQHHQQIFYFSSGEISEECDIFFKRPMEGRFFAVESINPEPIEYESGKPGRWVAVGGLCPPSLFGGDCPPPIDKWIPPQPPKIASNWGASGRFLIKDKTKDTFGIKVCARRTGINPGYQHVNIGWDEYKHVEKIEREVLAGGALTWAKPLEFIIDGDQIDPKLIVKPFNIMDGSTEYLLPGKGHKYVDFDKQQRRVIITAKEPSDLNHW